VIALGGVLVALLVTLLYTRLTRRAEQVQDGVISRAALGSATARDRIHRERLERVPMDASLVQRIGQDQRPVWDSRFLRGNGNGKGRRTA
jgi:hypothetical protein